MHVTNNDEEITTVLSEQCDVCAIRVTKKQRNAVIVRSSQASRYAKISHPRSYTVCLGAVLACFFRACFYIPFFSGCCLLLWTGREGEGAEGGRGRGSEVVVGLMD